jgi:hypothetical protein
MRRKRILFFGYCFLEVFMRRIFLAAFAVAFLGLTQAASAQFSLQALSSFGTNGWLAPGALGFNNQTTASVRGIAYDSTRNQVYVVDRSVGLTVEIRNGNTGALTGTLDVTGVSGGTFTANMIGVADDGAIYMGNLSGGATSPFKVYRWSDPSAAPTVAFNANSADFGRSRTGDSFAVTGSGANTRIVAAGGSGAEGGFLALTGDTTMTGSNQTITGVAAGGFRLSIDFAGGDTIVGAQTGALLNRGPVAGGAGGVTALTSAGEGLIAFDAQRSLLATVDINSSLVRLYDASNFASLTLLSSANLLTGPSVGNPNGVGALSFGTGPNGGLRLYVLNANNGIQAFNVIPEPSSALLALVGAGAGFFRRRRS